MYAEKGTAMHEVSEQCLIQNIEPKSFIGKKANGHIVTNEMVECVQVYVNYMRSLEGHKYYEEKITLVEVINDCFGTADGVVVHGGLMRVIDLKTGGGVRVEAEKNTQLMCYALGAYLKYSPVYDIDTITMTIVQPPMGSIDSWTINLDDLFAFAEELKKSYSAIQNEPDKFVASDKACKWCHAKSKCPEMTRLANDAASTDFANLDADGIDSWMPKLGLLKTFIDAVEAKAKDTLLSGGSVRGWKVVEGRKSRDWVDQAQVEVWLKQQGYDQIYTKPELLSVAQMEKALKGEVIDLSSVIKISYGSPTIAPEKDKRPSVDKNLSAKKDFS